MKNIDENAPDDVIRVLVGNKSDLHQKIIISSEDGKKLAEKFNVDYFETSAKSETNLNVTKMFSAITERILDRNEETPKHPLGDIDLLDHSSESTYERFMSCCSSATANAMNK